MGVSLALHAALLVIMALIIVHSRTVSDAELIVGWLTPKPDQAEEAPSERVPIEVASVPSPATPRPQSVERSTPEKQPVAPPAVRPADASRMLGGRSKETRERLLGSTGRADDVERAVEAGLAWLKRQQQSDGRWELHQGYPDAGQATLRTDTGATALGLLAFLGAGNTPAVGDHQAVVGKGLDWLKSIQTSDGDLHDHSELGRQTSYYAHCMATIALCEAYALTGDPSLQEPADRAVKFLLDSQHPTQGGWRYVPQTELTTGDLSVTGWALMALHTARTAGFDVPSEPFERASIFLDAVQEAGGSRYKYMPEDPPHRVTPALTAEGLLCRQWLGWPRDYPPMKEGVAWLLAPENQPEWSGGRRNVYAWYYTAQTLHNLGGPEWESWNRAVRDAVLSSQAKSGSTRGENDIRGSWHPVNPAGMEEEYAAKAGRLYVTAMCLLILEAPYRHLPLYESEQE